MTDDQLRVQAQRIRDKINRAKEQKAKGLLTKEQEAELETLERMFEFGQQLLKPDSHSPEK